MPKPKDEVLVTESQKQRLKKAQDKFYALLKAQGFSDIENPNLPNRPLKEWHNHKFSSEKSQIKMAIRAEYQKLVDDFTSSKYFDEVLGIMTKHGNCKVSPAIIKGIWHSSTQDGLTERKIAKDINMSKTAIHEILERLRQWMSLL